PGDWVKRKGVARVRLENGTIRIAEVHWYEAHGIRRKDLKIKRYVDLSILQPILHQGPSPCGSETRPIVRLFLSLTLVFVLTSPALAQSRPFDDWLADLLTEARTRGYSDELLQQTLVGITPLHRVIKSDRKQAEH